MLHVEYLILFCTFFLCTTCEGGVFKEYDLNQSKDENRKYYLSTLKVSYYDALQMCHEKDMQLVSIETNRKNKEIFKLFNSTEEEFWTSGNHIWLKGEPLEFDHFPYTRLMDYDNFSKFHCIIVTKLNNYLVWMRQSCDVEHPFICEKLKEDVTNPTCEDYSEDLVHGNKLLGKKYYIGREIITYSKALQVCRSMCMRLVSIESAEKNQDLFEAFLAANATEIFWSSGHFKPANVWKWTNGKVVDFTSWNIGEPNNAKGIEYCIEIMKNDEKIVWNDEPCEEKRMYICETIDKENDKL